MKYHKDVQKKAVRRGNITSFHHSIILPKIITTTKPIRYPVPIMKHKKMRYLAAPWLNYNSNTVAPARTSRIAAGERTLSAPLAFVAVGEVEPELVETMLVATPVAEPVVVAGEEEELTLEVASNKSVDWKV